MMATGNAPSATRRDTIFAPASGHGRAAVATIRISGPDTEAALAWLLAGALPEPRRASLRRLREPATGELLDQALVLWFPAPGSFTGEDQAELQIHGSLAVRAAILRALAGLAGCRPAEPGEFTRRALLNGKLDLTEVEGLADLIDAETEAQRRQALRQLEGQLSHRIESWRERLVSALVSCEAALDFSDEDDVPDDVADRAASIGKTVRREIAATLADADRGERIREGFQVVIAGPPNAGKSTLLNAIARRDVAIVSPVPGTTRDVIEVRCDLGGLPVSFLDTAGLRESEDLVEREGIARARARMGEADLVLWLIPSDEAGAGRSAGAEPGPGHDVVPRSLPSAGITTRSGQDEPEAGEVAAQKVPVLTLATKTDLAAAPAGANIAVSAKSGDGLPDLLSRIEEFARRATDGGGDAVLTRERHRAVLVEVVRCLDHAASVGHRGAIELLAEDFRLALRQLGRMTGAVDVEEVLDRIFSSFCIGK